MANLNPNYTGVPIKTALQQTPATSGPSVGTAYDAGYASQQNALATQLNNTNTILAGDESNVRAQYGFDPEYANNPYTKANLLARAAQQRFTGTTNAKAAAGQLYSGSLNNQRGYDQFAADEAMNNARVSYAQALQDISNRRLTAQSNYALGDADAFSSMLGRLTSSTPDPSLFGASSDTSGSSGPSAADIAKAQNILKNQQGKTAGAISWAKTILGR